MRIRGDELAQCGRTGSGQPDDEDWPFDCFVRDLGVIAVGLLDLQAGDEQCSQPSGHDAHARVAEIRFVAERSRETFESFAMAAVAEIAEVRLRPRGGFEHVRVERRDVDAHRDESPRDRRASIGDRERALLRRDTFGTRREHGVELVEANDPRRGHRRRFGTDATQDHRPLGVTRGVDPVRDPGIAVRDDRSEHAVSVDHRLVTVEARDVLRVVNRLPPDVPDRQAPIQPDRRRHLDEQRLVRFQLP